MSSNPIPIQIPSDSLDVSDSDSTWTGLGGSDRSFTAPESSSGSEWSEAEDVEVPMVPLHILVRNRKPGICVPPKDQIQFRRRLVHLCNSLAAEWSPIKRRLIAGVVDSLVLMCRTAREEVFMNHWIEHGRVFSDEPAPNPYDVDYLEGEARQDVLKRKINGAVYNDTWDHWKPTTREVVTSMTETLATILSWNLSPPHPRC